MSSICGVCMYIPVRIFWDAEVFLKGAEILFDAAREFAQLEFLDYWLAGSK